ncbi:MAG TPA: hypothetical protein VHE83_06515 [Mycobacteriales bacterium]|nr:hypothetical protein [Mycobacteriales bacterium]
MNVQALPRTVITGYLSLARLPLNAVAKVTGRREDAQWPPFLVFERLEAAVETKAGALLRDDVLLELGRVREAKVAELQKAAQLEALAETKRQEAREEFTERREQVERQRREAAQRVEQREQQIERDAERKEAEARKKAAKKEALARDAKSTHEKAIERRERAARADALTQEAKALEAQEEALGAAAAIDAIDDAIERNKAVRKSG